MNVQKKKVAKNRIKKRKEKKSEKGTTSVPIMKRKRWTADEDAALFSAAAVCGEGNWRQIQRHDAQQDRPRLLGRSNVQLKDRVRTLKGNGRWEKTVCVLL